MNEDKIEALKKRKDFYWNAGYLWLVVIAPLLSGSFLFWFFSSGVADKVVSWGIHPIFGGMLLGVVFAVPLLGGRFWLTRSIDKADNMIRSLKNEARILKAEGI